MDEYFTIVLPQEILDAKERRKLRQHAMLAIEGSCVISFTLNIAGHIKLSPCIHECFMEGIRQIGVQLKQHHIAVLKQEQWVEKTGCEAMFSVESDAVKVKHIMVGIEEGSQIGRLFDIDVLSKDGCPISRSALGLASRRCIVCDNPAHECIRGQYHEISVIKKKTEHIIRDYFLQKRADFIAATACRSMMYEVCVTPKPGLVDRSNSGAHQDMDIFTFIDSISVLTPHFRYMYLMGSDLNEVPPQQLLDKLRYSGIMAENDMLAATNRINTHKGLIYSMGILCAALGWSEANYRSTDAASLLALCGEIASPGIDKDLHGITSENAVTGGEKLFAATGNAGVRGEAAAGFPSILNCGLPALKRFISEGMNLNDAGVYTLLTLISQVTDTNIISRCGLSAQQTIQKSIQTLLSENTLPGLNDVRELDCSFIEKNISPGGCADLLAMTFMLYFLETYGLDTSIA
ncbi:MAG TPA: triphosphoribosyl-dephospho-CoA synthase CitG [Bacillota bacterium]|jgi:holo-ACP synthase/triphosphoribosyl-dephospho-CoA synthase|nr:triphosphoribosyl-dephospho-CoA synthase CitG [Bacillota bacterium]HQE65490.1 triphosphoribosyl-dephospho-CoA synthase CitG [Bacillota bacterium]HQJ36921.1 triphosphoribosyl-dephospho-CoA synthase CitG [Bacillota bacterium]HRS20401.1 triphosphoribosyl-dephospho-CoA synthase CitG [Clostridia bacterium]